MTGIVGFITFFGIYIAIFYSTWRAFKQKWIDLPIAAILFSLPVAYFVQNLFVFDHPAGFSMSYLLFALIIAATKGEFVGEREVATEKNKEVAYRSAPWTGYAILMLVMAFVVLRTSINPFQISRKALISNATFSVNPAAAYQLSLEASQVWTPYLDEQSFLLSRNLIALLGSGAVEKFPQWKDIYELAKKLSREEIQRHPKNTHPQFIFARLAQEAMRYISSEGAVAEQMYQSAIDTSPKRQQLHYGLARLYLMTGNLDPAINIFRNVISFDPDFGEGYWNLGIALMYDKKDLQGGAEQIKKALSVAYPYRLQAGREMFVVLDSLLVRQDYDGIQAMIDNLSKDYPVATADIYAQLVYKLQVAEQPDLAQALFKAAAVIDPSTPDVFQKLLQQVSGATAQPVQASTTSSAPVATATYSGLRR